MRKWTIKGAELNGDKGKTFYSTADGPVPAVNELVPVVEKKYFDILVEALKKIKCACNCEEHNELCACSTKVTIYAAQALEKVKAVCL